MTYLSQVNCFECNGYNQSCEYYGMYVEGRGAECIYRKIARDDLHYDSKGLIEKVQLRDMLREYKIRRRV